MGNVQVGDLKFGPAARLNMRKLKLDWFDWILERGPQPEQSKSAVYLYRAGEEAWIEANSLNHIAERTLALLLTSEGSLVTADTPSENNGSVDTFRPRTFLCDPSDERVILSERNLRSVASAVKENAPTIRVGKSYNDLMTYVIGADPKNEAFLTPPENAGVAYISQALDASLTLSGHPIAKLWLSLSAPDADLAILVAAQLPDGEGFSLSGDIFRMRDRNGAGREEIVTPGTPILVERSLRFVSRTLPAGSRIQLIVRSGTSIRLEKNLQSASPVRYQRPDEAIVANVNVYSEPERQSSIVFPVI
jgi:predicted acyl esterase